MKYSAEVTSGGYTGKIVDKNGDTVAIVNNYEQAILFASAPELLEALKNLLAVMNSEGGTSPNAQETARQVIAKAEGNQRSIYCQLNQGSYCTHCGGHEHLCRQAIANTGQVVGYQPISPLGKPKTKPLRKP